MRIFISCNTLSIGGAERVAVNLANGLAANGHEVYIVTDLKKKITYHVEDAVKKLPLITLDDNKIQKWVTAIKNMRGYIKKYQPDIVIGVMHTCSFVSKLASVGLPVLVVMTIHHALESKAYKHKWYNQLIDRITPPLYRHTTVLTEEDRKILVKWNKRISVMPNPVTFKTTTGNEKKKQILAAGRIGSWHCKGFDVLIKSWSLIAPQFPDWTLLIAGDGDKESMEFLYNLATEEGVSHRINFLGFQADMLPLYQECAIFALSSRSEGLPMVLLEAMSQGCAPVVTSNLGRTKEILPEEDLGLICEPEDVEGFANNLQEMITNRDFREKVQRNVVKRVEYYSLPNVVSMWEQLIKQLVRQF